MNILDRYTWLSENLAETKEDSFILDCFKYGIFKTNPSNKHKKNFKYIYEVDYPENFSDLSKKTIKNIKQTIKVKKEEEKFKKKREEERAKKGYATSDTWSIVDWFLSIMPKMLEEMKNNLHGNPVPLGPINSQALNLEDEGEESKEFKEWKATLEEMIFLLKEMNEDTCSLKNPYEKEYFKTMEDFKNKYGLCGEKLKTKEQLEEERKSGSSVWLNPSHFPDLYPEFKDLQKSYFNYERAIFKYRNNCKEKFFHRFSENFWDLWD